MKTTYCRIDLVPFQFWAAYFGCDGQYKDSVQQCIEQIDVIKRLVEMYPDDLTFVTDADGLYPIFIKDIWGSKICKLKASSKRCPRARSRA